MVAERLAADWSTMANGSVKWEEVGCNRVTRLGQGSLNDEVEADASYKSQLVWPKEANIHKRVPRSVRASCLKKIADVT